MADNGRVSVQAALALIEASVRPLERSEIVPVGAGAIGCLTAADVHVRRDVPPADVSAMDGFALRSADVWNASADLAIGLRLAPPIPAGSGPRLLLPGEAAPISTGAVVPSGADAVLVKERAKVADGALVLSEAVDAGANVRIRGEDFRTGSLLLARGSMLTAEAIGALAACGIRDVVVRSMPSIALWSTGSELVGEDGGAFEPGTIDSNRPMIEAACAEARIPCHFMGRVRDDLTEATALFTQAMSSPIGDILVTTGGISAGDYDFVRSALEERGGKVLFHGMNMRPGKPLLFALLPDGRPFFGLPGNPVSALVGFRFFVATAIRRMLGLGREAGVPVETDAAARAGMTLFLKGQRIDSRWTTEGLDQRSHVLSSVLAADGWLRVEQSEDGAASSSVFPKAVTLL